MLCWTAFFTERIFHTCVKNTIAFSTFFRYNKDMFLFNDALNTFYLQLYGVRHMVKDHSNREKGNPMPPHRLLLPSGPSCSLGYFPFQPVVHNWFIKGRGMYCSVYGKVHIKDPLLLIEKSSLCGGSGFPSKKCVNVTI